MDEGRDALYFMRARYYNADRGRFLSEDPVWDENLFPYGNNNPATNIDPNGDCPICLVLGEAGFGIATGYGIAKLTGQDYTWKNAAFDGALGAITAGASIYAGIAKIGAKGGIASSRALGRAMEESLGMLKSKTSINIGGKIRFPDRLTNGFLEEAKNVAHLNFTRQLKDYLKYSQDNGLQMILHTRGSTTFSKTLQKLIDDGIIIHKKVPGF